MMMMMMMIIIIIIIIIFNWGPLSTSQVAWLLDKCHIMRRPITCHMPKSQVIWLTKLASWTGSSGGGIALGGERSARTVKPPG